MKKGTYVFIRYNSYFLTYFLRIVNEFARKRNIHGCSNRKRQDDALNMGKKKKKKRMREIAETIVSVFEKGYDLKNDSTSGWNGTPVVRFNQSKKSNTVLERGVTTEARWRGALHLYSCSRFSLTYYVDHVLRIFAHFSFDSLLEKEGGEGGKEKRRKKNRILSEGGGRWRRRKKKKKMKKVSSTAWTKSWDLSNPYPPYSKMTIQLVKNL